MKIQSFLLSFASYYVFSPQNRKPRLTAVLGGSKTENRGFQKSRFSPNPSCKAEAVAETSRKRTIN